MPMFFRILAVLAAAALTGCSSTYGARTVEPAQADYNAAIATSSDQQILSNLVRLRYRDTTSFLQVTGVVTQYQYRGALGVEGRAALGGGSSIGGNANVLYQEMPTVTYAPLAGRAFAERLLSPISPETVIALSAQGWSLRRLLLCCVERVNDLVNAPSATGPTPDALPDNSAFIALADRLRRLQQADLIALQFEQDSYFLVIEERAGVSAQLAEDLRRVRQTLNLAPDRRRYRLTALSGTYGGDTIEIRARSMLGVLFALSHAVDVPQEDIDLGLVTMSQPQAGAPANWQALLGEHFRVRSAAKRPKDAYLAVQHRGSWFYIADSDLQSKSTFMLVNYLLALQSAAAEGGRPLLTLPAGS